MSKFYAREHYSDSCNYRLLPFNFRRLNNQVIVSNIAGETTWLTSDELKALVDHTLDCNSDIYSNLKSKHFLIDNDSDVAIDLLALKVRTKYKTLSDFTSLHLFNVTLRCDHACTYCQVSPRKVSTPGYDMSEDVAEKALDFTFKSPSPAITLEFQGGESLLVFDRVKQIVLGAEKRNLIHQKLIQFVITTNLSQLTDEMLDFCDEHQILISTSLDGPEWLHNSNRPRPGRDAYQKTIEGINKARHILGHDRVGALMTTTKATLAHITDVIDEYINHDFDHIVLRPLSPYGFAISKKVYEGYSTEEWIESYKVALDYILEINRQGHFFAEGFTALLVSKIFSPTPTSYVDLQSPTGAGIAAISFNYDGNVYATDESRMLAEMNDYYFKMGNLESDTYEDIMLNESYLDVLESTILDSVPMCEQCAYKPFCGSDPVYHHALHNDDIGHKMDSGHCKKMTGVLDHLFELMKNDEIKQLLLKWIRL